MAIAKTDKTTTRRKFLAGAAVVGAGAIAMPQVSRAQTTTLKMQGSWGAKDVFNEMAEDYVERVNDDGRRRGSRSTTWSAARWCIRSRCSTACMAASSTPPIP